MTVESLPPHSALKKVERFSEPLQPTNIPGNLTILATSALLLTMARSVLDSPQLTETGSENGTFQEDLPSKTMDGDHTSFKPQTSDHLNRIID